MGIPPFGTIYNDTILWLVHGMVSCRVLKEKERRREGERGESEREREGEKTEMREREKRENTENRENREKREQILRCAGETCEDVQM